jgi:hypothetical protein
MLVIAVDETAKESRKQSLARRIAFLIFWLLSIAVYIFFFAVLVGFNAGFDSSEIFHTAAAFLYSTIVVAGLLVAWNGRFGGTGLWMVIAAGIANLLVLVVVGNPDNMGGQAGWFDVANLIFVVPLVGVVALHPQRSELGKMGRSVNARLISLAVIAGFPAMWLAIEQALNQRNSWPPKSDPHHNSHWLTSGSVLGALALIALVAAFRRRGSEFAALSYAGGLAILGGVSLLFPDAASSFGRGWGAAAVLVGVLFGFESVRDAERKEG